MASKCPYMSCCTNDDDSDTGSIYRWAVCDLKKSRIVFVLGGPGSGKGTQCDRIVQRYGFTHLSSGDLLREEVSNETQLAVQIKAVMDKGQLVPLEMVLTLLKQAIQKHSATSKGFLIDGYPRELDQGRRFEAEVAPVERVIYFQVSDQTMKSRIMKRATYSGRSDDNETTVSKRLATFHANNQPVVDYYNNQRKLCTINAEGSVDEVFNRVVACLDGSKNRNPCPC